MFFIRGDIHPDELTGNKVFWNTKIYEAKKSDAQFLNYLILRIKYK